MSATAGLTVAALASAAAVFAQSRPNAPATIGVDEVRPGMRGYGRSVFHGTRVENFDVEVVDVLHGFRPGMDLVLVRTSHPELNDAGTVAGMSGSPIYIDNRLLGAYAYGWEFGRSTVAGVTPIRTMLGELARVRHTPPGTVPGSQVPLPIGGTPIHACAWDTLASELLARRTPVATSGGSLVPAAVPLSVGGMSDGAFHTLSDGLEALGLIPVQSSGSGRPVVPAVPNAPTHYEPGGAVHVTLMTGDITAGATGTVTAQVGDEFLGFGHPMMGFGETAIPTALAYIAWINPGYRRSFKMSEPLQVLGALEQDRPFTIIFNEHATAPMLPMHVHVESPTHPTHPDWNVQMVYQRQLVPRLFGSVVGTAIETSTGENGDLAWSIVSRIATRDHGTLEFTDQGVSAEGNNGIQTGSLRATDAIERLTENPFAQVRIDRIDATVSIRLVRDAYFVRSVAASRSEGDPGDTVSVYVSLGRYGMSPEVRAVPVRLPREMAGRDVEVEVGAGNEVLPELPEPESIDDLLRNLTSSYPIDALVVSVRMPGQGVMVRGRVVSDLPSSALDVLRPVASTDTGEPFLNVRRTVIPMGRVVIGRDRVRVHVREIRQ